MTKKVIIFLLFLSLFGIYSCNKKKKDVCCKEDISKNETVNAVISDMSVYNLDSKWINQNNDTIILKDLANKITVAAMIFTHCESACPRIVADMQRIEKAFSEAELQNIQFLLISMDPERDTPVRFTEFMKEHQLDEKWIGISSNDASTMELSNVFNVRIKKLSDGGFDHSNIIRLLDKKGDIVFQQNGLSKDPEEIINKINELLNQYLN